MSVAESMQYLLDMWNMVWGVYTAYGPLAYEAIIKL